jgi:hypothetical protein
MRLNKKLNMAKKGKVLMELVKDFEIMYKLKLGETTNLTNPLGKFTITKLEDGDNEI